MAQTGVSFVIKNKSANANQLLIADNQFLCCLRSIADDDDRNRIIIPMRGVKPISLSDVQTLASSLYYLPIDPELPEYRLGGLHT